MELFFFRPAEYERLYNCTGLIIDSVPLEQRQFMPESIIICILSTIYYVLYLPCIYSIWKNMRDNSCYKMLFYIGITDLVNMFVLDYFSAWLSFRGAVFCSNPTLIYFAGMTAQTIYIAESTMDLELLGPDNPSSQDTAEINIHNCQSITGFGTQPLSRAAQCPCLAFSVLGSPHKFLAHRLFPLCALLDRFIKPAVFSGLFFAWFYDPFIGYRKTGNEYEERIQIVHDTSVAVLCPIIYFILAAKPFFDIRKNCEQFGNFISELDTLRVKTFLQVFLISLIHSLAGFFYVYLQYNEAHQWMITLAEFAWFHIHGFPPVIYWALNKTIREDCRMLYNKLFQSNRVNVVSGVTVLRPR
ncbi:hypothetical protein niasHT_039285 [Heterodera trifolii]|uniref:Uncharacterized protein n=1 Tax=Heterodera trifolii TaxID=157864 RepID=A0ABD2J804_9BILA